MSRTKRMTKKQKEILIGYLEENRELVNSAGLDAKNFELVKNKWISLGTLLNKDALGPSKTVNQWKEAVSELKTKIKKKARDLAVEAQGTGGGPKKNKDLTDIEERLINIISKVVITGVPGLEEPGLQISNRGQEQEEIQWEMNSSFDENIMTFPCEEKIDAPSCSTVITEIPNNNISKYYSYKRKRSDNSQILKTLIDSNNVAMTNLAESNKNIANALLELAAAVREVNGSRKDLQ